MSSSPIYPNEFIITDATPDHLLTEPMDGSKGLELARGDAEYAYGATASAFPQELIIPRHEWQARIQEKDERKTHLSQIMRAAKLPAKNQGRTNYCWIFAPVHCLEIIRLIQNQPMVSLSPASAGAYIKNFRNVGGWGKEGLEFIADRGVCPSSLWPDTSLSRSHATEENRAVAVDYRVTEWWELRPRNLDEQISLLLRNIPGAAGRNRWRHETTDLDAIWVDGAVAIRGRNQWPNWGDDNYFVMQGNAMLADDLVAPRVAVAA